MPSTGMNRYQPPRADELGIRNYPDLHAGLQYLRAEALFDAGRYDETAALLSGMMKKLYLVPNRELLPRMLSLSAKSFVLCGDPVRHTASLFSGLWLYYDDHEVRSAIVRTLVTVHRGVFRLLSDGSVSLPNRIAFLLNWTGCLGRKTRLSRLWILGWLYLLHGVIHAAVMRHPAPAGRRHSRNPGETKKQDHSGNQGDGRGRRSSYDDSRIARAQDQVSGS